MCSQLYFRSPCKELVLPDKTGNWDDDVITDGLIQINEDLVGNWKEDIKVVKYFKCEARFIVNFEQNLTVD